MASLRGLYRPSSITASFSPVLSNHGRSSSATARALQFISYNSTAFLI
jgi:hypothetical protein